MQEAEKEGFGYWDFDREGTRKIRGWKIVRTPKHEAEFIREKQSGERAPPPRPSPSLRDPTDTSPPRGAPQFDQLATTSHMLLLAARAAHFSGSPLDRPGESVQ